MTDHADREGAAFVEALVYRLRNRGDGRDQYPADDELFARDFLAVALGRGWRPVEALTPPRPQPAGPAPPISQDVRRALEDARRTAAEASERRRAQLATGAT